MLRRLHERHRLAFLPASLRSVAHGVAVALALGAASCSGAEENGDEDPSVVGRVAQAFTDSDSDGMDDDWETTHFGGLSRTGSGDFDSDGMTDLEEYTYGFDPTVADGFDDADGDRFPNVYELRNGSDPTVASSLPTPGYVVNGGGGGTHTTVSAALSAAGSGSDAYPIIGIAAGTYSGAGNLNVSVNISKKPLIIGLEGASKTIFDNGGGWSISTTAIIASLTFQRIASTPALSAWGGSNEFRFVDLLVKDSTASLSYATAINVDSAAKTFVLGSTFMNNTGNATRGQIYIGSGQATIANTVVWSSASGPTPIVAAGSATLTTSYSLSKGQTLTGTGNLSGSTDPKLRPDGRLLVDSPLRGAGGGSPASLLDMDLEARSSSTPDIGVDQFVDSDADDLADAWEVATAGNLTTLTSATADGDSDGLTNQEEYANRTNPSVADTDADGLSDGDEVTVHGTSPIVADTDGDGMPDGWEIGYGLSATTANAYDDDDGDRFPNIYEYTYSTDPSDRGSTPTPTYVVNGSGGGTHTTVSAALSAAGSASGSYPIIGIAPGTYTGSGNLGISVNISKKPLIIGLEGASKTIFDQGTGWFVSSSAVISSLTFQRITSPALSASGSTTELRLFDLLVKDCAASLTNATVHVSSASKTYIGGSTFLDNAGHGTYGQIYIGSGAATIVNTVVWTSASAATPPIVAAAGATLTTSYCLSKGQTLTGTGNLSGATDPKLRFDGRLRFDSPLRGAGGTVPWSRLDMDGELRSASTPDIGVDQIVDSDSDGLADAWELATTGNLTTLTGTSQDYESDGLDNAQEYESGGNPTVADTDGDGLSDSDEVLVHGTSPAKTDTDGDGMPDAWEVAHGLPGATADAFDDADGDRYPNIYEYAYGTDPSDRASMPTATYVVSATGGGTHSTVQAAILAANSHSHGYPIVGIQPGVYSGTGNSNLSISLSKKPLIIGLEGASKTVFDQVIGWAINSPAIVSSLTFQRTSSFTLWVNVPLGEVRFNDLLIKNTLSASAFSSATGIHVFSGDKVFISGTTILENTTHPFYGQIYVGSGTATIRNTVVWSSSSGPTALVTAGSGSVTTTNCLVKGQTLSGTGNLAGTTNPKMNSEGRLRWDSPLRGAGGTFALSRIDMDGELRPVSTPDIGVDQIVDSDSDDLPDSWEMAYAGDLTTLVSATQDNDGDGLTNAEEYEWDANPLDADTDNDGIQDGNELTYSMNPAVADADDLVTDDNEDGLIDTIGGQLGHQPNQSDDDGDGVSNADEILMCTNPFRADTDGDGVPDSTDVFPHDPLMSSLPTNGSDTTAPVITLTAPWNAVLQ